MFYNCIINYYNVNNKKQRTIEILCKKGILRFGNTLFSESEQDYFDYLLNKHKFSNGKDLCNKYLHGTQTIDKKIHQVDYYTFIRLFSLCILKINDEFSIYRKCYNT